MAARLLKRDYIDATPERIAKGDSAFINPAEIDSSEQPIGLTRRFQSSHLDRLYRPNADKNRPSPLTYRQWYAGDWYRNQHARCSFSLALIASYGERTSAGEPNYGLPRSEAQLRARSLFRMARLQFPQDMVGFMDRFLLHDGFPRFGGRQAMKNLDQIRDALDRLADWLKVN